MNTCATCKWWEERKERWQKRGFGWCNRILNADAGDAAVVSGEDCDIVTRPDFGCTLWEPKG